MTETQQGPGQGASRTSRYGNRKALERALALATAHAMDQYGPGPHIQEMRLKLISDFHATAVPVQKVAPPEAETSEALDWAAFLETDLGAMKWHAGQLLEQGQQMSLIGAGKVGKSLLTLEWAVAMSAGYSFLGDEKRESIPVLYLDQENSPRDIQRRIKALGYQADELKNLTYLSFPSVGPLDTRDGAAALMKRVNQFNPQVVILDTVSRFISKPENDSNTWLELYNLSLKRLKARGISLIRLDHFGKDTDRGGRGSSAKTQDIDHVWELTEQGRDTFRLRRTYTRSGLGPDDLMLTRHGAPGENGTTWHEVRADGPRPFEGLAAQAAVKQLDLAGIPIDYGRDRAKDAGMKLGIREKGNAFWGDVVAIRKAPGYVPWTSENLPGGG